MDIVAHVVFGFWLSTKLGTEWGIFFSAILDIDHLLGYLYDKRKKKTIEIPSLLHLAYRQRTWLHSIFGVFIITLVFIQFLDWRIVFFPLLFHLFLDAIDKIGIYILPPFTKKKIKGILPVGYLIEEPGYLKRHKRSHIPSIILIVLTIILILLNVQVVILS